MRVNVNQKRFAVAAALAASSVPALVQARGHKISRVPEIPLVISSSAEQLKKTWKTGLLGGGYTVPLQWDRAPTTTKIRVIVRFTMPDGREYEAERDANVTPLPGLAPRPSFPGNELPPPTIVPPGNDAPAATLRPILMK